MESGYRNELRQDDGLEKPKGILNALPLSVIRPQARNVLSRELLLRRGGEVILNQVRVDVLKQEADLLVFQREVLVMIANEGGEDFDAVGTECGGGTRCLRRSK